MCVTQAADDEIQIFVPGATKRESVDTSSTSSDVNVSAADSDANVMPCNSDLRDTSLDASEAVLLCGDDSSTTVIEETSTSVLAGDDITDVKPLTSPSEESHNDYADIDNELPDDIADDKFVSASEGELFHSVNVTL